MFFDKLEPEVQHLLRQKELTITPIGAQKGTDRVRIICRSSFHHGRRTLSDVVYLFIKGYDSVLDSIECLESISISFKILLSVVDIRQFEFAPVV